MQCDSGAFAVNVRLTLIMLCVCCSLNLLSSSTLLQFAKENGKMDMASEMMGDAVDDALDDGEVEDETDDLMNQVCISSNCLYSSCTMHYPTTSCCSGIPCPMVPSTLATSC